jgi:hypothetical protein
VAKTERQFQHTLDALRAALKPQAFAGASVKEEWRLP